jgi:TolA-binding protein
LPSLAEDPRCWCGAASGCRELEIAELVADLDKVSAEKDSAVTELTARITGLESQVAAMEGQLEQARAAERKALKDATEGGTGLAAAEARAATLQEAHDALLQRIVPKNPAPE